MTELNKVGQFATAMLNAATLDDLLWSIAENIGKTLGFDDCVIYLNVNKVLIQKAAYGIKNPNDRELLNSIMIKVGQGIVGAVAQSKVAEVIPNTALDTRYINDEFSGKSEITVPIIFENNTIGIIDSESANLDNYDSHDVELLQIIANIAAPRIASALYRSTLQKTQLQLEKTNGKLETSLYELKKNQEILIHSEKMASIGLLAAGVAHEINNPLSFSISNLTVFKDYYDHIKEMHEKLISHAEMPLELKNQLLSEDYSHTITDIANIVEETNEGLLRIKNIVSDLCGYIRKEDRNFSNFDINDGIKTAINVLKGEINNDCHLELNLENLPSIQGNKSKIHQVFVNIILNALQATDKNGLIKVKTYRNNNHACIDITDNGSGIENKNLQNIFTPFFTTKPVNKGTGLGLFICHRIITEEHTGRIQVSSNDNETTFRIMLPFINANYEEKSLTLQH
ncbi:MAG: GAF domain-containing protein [Colwellia sp.]|nr:GAF domain-containing protein [Colwellia sp.]